MRTRHGSWASQTIGVLVLDAINFPLITYLFFFRPDAWFKWGLLITLIYSNYVNWSTNLGGMAASSAVMNITVVNVAVDPKANK